MSYVLNVFLLELSRQGYVFLHFSSMLRLCKIREKDIRDSTEEYWYNSALYVTGYQSITSQIDHAFSLPRQPGTDDYNPSLNRYLSHPGEKAKGRKL